MTFIRFFDNDGKFVLDAYFDKGSMQYDGAKGKVVVSADGIKIKDDNSEDDYYDDDDDDASDAKVSATKVPRFKGDKVLYKKPKLRPGTAMNYRLVISKHLVPFFGAMRLDAITTADVQRFYNQHAHQARSTVRTMGILLHGIFESAIEDGLCTIDPTRSKRLTMTQKKTVREALPIDQAQDIINNLHRLEPRDRVLVALLIFTGIRRGEALGLQWADIDFDRKLISINRAVRFAGNRGYIGPTKSSAGIRLIPLSPQLEDALNSVPHSGKYILGNGTLPITEMTYKRGWERICRTIDMHGATAHVLRHTYITMAAAHLDVKTLQTIAGHADISTTMNRYAHGREDKIIQANALLAGMYGGN